MGEPRNHVPSPAEMDQREAARIEERMIAWDRRLARREQAQREARHGAAPDAS